MGLKIRRITIVLGVALIVAGLVSLLLANVVPGLFGCALLAMGLFLVHTQCVSLAGGHSHSVGEPASLNKNARLLTMLGVSAVPGLDVLTTFIGTHVLAVSFGWSLSNAVLASLVYFAFRVAGLLIVFFMGNRFMIYRIGFLLYLLSLLSLCLFHFTSFVALCLIGLSGLAFSLFLPFPTESSAVAMKPWAMLTITVAVSMVCWYCNAVGSFLPVFIVTFLCACYIAYISWSIKDEKVRY